MDSTPPSRGLSHTAGHKDEPEFWQQLDRDFPFEGINEDQLRQQTEQWLTCASELLGMPPSRSQKKQRC